jgi:hypothetical protein
MSRVLQAMALTAITSAWPTISAQVPELPPIAEVINGSINRVTYRGKSALRLDPMPASAGKDENMLAIVDGPAFVNGTIEIEVAGAPKPTAPPDSRGFVGIAFRTGPHGEWSEVFYLRPTNGRADDPVRRNRAVQYASDPEYPWHRLRSESPGKYESYVDLETGAWAALRIEVVGATARLYVHGASEPTLIVNDLKHGTEPGAIALWAHVETDAYFGEMTVVRR